MCLDIGGSSDGNGHANLPAYKRVKNQKISTFNL
jgi:hypothetical protein